ncbi:hypothetical protein C8J56DRAFT_1162084 [Mycena floridula]|nr:hypothetical protein C8J56DRAFT_1162084 [Mycena floridula]
MGRTRTKKKPAVRATEAPISAPSVSALLEKAQDLIFQCDYPLAQRFIVRVLEREPTHPQAKEMLGVVQLETGEIEAAKQTFLSLLVDNPPPSAHLYLAQLSDDEPLVALQHYQAAVDILTVQLKGKDRATGNGSTEDEAETKNNIVRALVGQVEIWMDPSYDLCFEPEAEQKCEELLNQALQLDPGNAEALQTLASVRMSQQRQDDAKECLEKSWTAWKDLELDDPKVPPIPTRLALVKLFLELSLFTPALLVLHGVMSSDDEEVEAWYLEGWCYLLMSEQAQENGGTLDELPWQDLAKDSRDRLETCQMLHVNENHPDIPLLDHVKELIAKLDAMGIKPSPLEEEDQKEWEDVDSSGDEDVEMS